MKTKRLGSRGPELSVIGYGAWEAGLGAEWGSPPPEDQVLEAIRRCLDVGINWIDTAERYGDGRSEEIVAEALTGRRDEVLLATKVAPAPDGTGFRPGEIARACRQSLTRLRTDHIDLYQLHWPDETGVPMEDTWGAMGALVDEGLTRFVGVSNFDQALIERCEVVRHVDSAQQEFSMLTLAERDLIRWCGQVGTGVISYGPLAYGLLTGAITMETSFDEQDHRGPGGDYAWGALFEPTVREGGLAVVAGMRPIAHRLGVTLTQLALAWNFHQQGVTAAIVGSRSPDHVQANASAADIELDTATLDELEELLPHGPGVPPTGTTE